MTADQAKTRPGGGTRRVVTGSVLVGLATASTVGLTACGLPGEGEIRTIESDAVPYHLLEEEPAPIPGQDDDRGAARVPAVFWVAGDDRLIPAAADASCADDPSTAVEHVLAELAAGPGDAARAAGRASAIPPESHVGMLRLVDGVAQVELEPATTISPERLPLAVGQVVLAVTSAQGVEAVRFVSEDEPVPAPLPGGALTSRPVSADDYAPLLPDRYLAGGSPRPTVSGVIGCPPI